MSCMIFNSRLDMSHYGPQHAFKDAGAVAGNLTGFHNETMLRCQQELHIQGCLGVLTGRNLEDSNLASVEAMQ
jgi:hypothetical protein